MSVKLLCPLQFGSPNNECVPSCAWNAGSLVEPRCAILDISMHLTSIDESEFAYKVVPNFKKD